MEETKTQVYEFSYLLMPTIPEAEVAKKVAALKELFEKNTATFIAEEYPEFIHLAYTMIKVINNKHERVNNAYFGWFKCEAPATILESIKMTLDRDDELVRYLLIKTVKESTLAPKKVTQKRDVRAKHGKDEAAAGADAIPEAATGSVEEVTAMPETPIMEEASVAETTETAAIETTS
jgi:ribosomal protein S6